LSITVSRSMGKCRLELGSRETLLEHMDAGREFIFAWAAVVAGMPSRGNDAMEVLRRKLILPRMGF
jgi:hypothetical protein